MKIPRLLKILLTVLGGFVVLALILPLVQYASLVIWMTISAVFGFGNYWELG